MSALPYGWTQRDLDAVTKLAGYFHADPRGILAIFRSESGLQPRLGPINVLGYYGLSMALPAYVDPVIHDSWVDIVKNRPIADQVAAIKTYWDASAKGNLGGDSVQSRARKLGVRGDTVLYSLNFVPAYFAKVKSAKEPMVVSSSYAATHPQWPSHDGGSFYNDNPAFDLDGKGYISVLDVQKRLDKMIADAAHDPTTGPLFGYVKKPFSVGKAAVVTALVGGGIFLLTRK